MKSLAKKIVATALTVASIATMTTCVATANAANMEYHIDTTRKASLTLHKYEMSDTSLATHKATGTTDDAQYVPADAKPGSQYRKNILVTAVQKLDGMGKRAVFPVLIDFEIPDNTGKQNDR